MTANIVSTALPTIFPEHLTTDELVNLAINFYRRNYIEELCKLRSISPDHTMELL